MKIRIVVNHPIDLQEVFITFDEYYCSGNEQREHFLDKSRYRKDKDEKWLKFVEKHKLSKYEQCITGKWYDMYLRLCAEGLL